MYGVFFSFMVFPFHLLCPLFIYGSRWSLFIEVVPFGAGLFPFVLFPFVQGCFLKLFPFVQGVGEREGRVFSRLVEARSTPHPEP